MSFLVWDDDEAPEEEHDEREWTAFHEATHATVARSFGYNASAHVNSNGSGATKVW